MSEFAAMGLALRNDGDAIGIFTPKDVRLAILIIFFKSV